MAKRCNLFPSMECDPPRIIDRLVTKPNQAPPFSFPFPTKD
ncbi:hypothetical protein RISK_000509 [Rhodopirellula islandica]|uniref:Uncharacterized protein n=1 Tax=Rhodopirellula islandica TaxID=595434 RepID=A0A0J1BLP7_RHOIS|nr:hypothetical protein RISK_000509 [Rhodopirellula islandica]